MDHRIARHGDHADHVEQAQRGEELAERGSEQVGGSPQLEMGIELETIEHLLSASEHASPSFAQRGPELRRHGERKSGFGGATGNVGSGHGGSTREAPLPIQGLAVERRGVNEVLHLRPASVDVTPSSPSQRWPACYPTTRVAPSVESVPAPRPPREESTPNAWLRGALAVALLFVFLVGIAGLGDGFKGLGKGLLDSFFTATTNPFMGLVVGILATTLVQSSSVTTSMIVALVAAQMLTVSSAIPMIMGANIGTAVTSTLVALTQMNRKEDFRRAFGAATIHDCFNLLSVAILLPVELLTGYLETSSRYLASAFASGGGSELPNPVKDATKWAVAPVADLCKAVTTTKQGSAIALIVCSAILIYVALYFLVMTLRTLMATRVKTYIRRSLDANPYVGLVVGLVVTVSVQSSSITTSVVVPLAGAGLISLPQVLPITIGANIGTTVTALLATMAAPSETLQLAVQIALVHLLFNLTGMALMFPVKATRRVPLFLAEKLGNLAADSKKAAVACVLSVFYGIPALLIFASRAF